LPHRLVLQRAVGLQAPVRQETLDSAGRRAVVAAAPLLLGQQLAELSSSGIILEGSR